MSRLADKEVVVESVLKSRLSPEQLSRVCEDWDRGVEGMEAHQRGMLACYKRDQYICTEITSLECCSSL